jgi:hypothetical protein
MPLEQLLWALATYCTVVATVLLLVGAETKTPAEEKPVKHTSTHKVRSRNFMKLSSC